MAEAVCIRCGNRKPAPWGACTKCHYDPTADSEALIKSVYLSAGRFSEPDRKTRYRAELEKVAAAMEQGHQPTFEEAELIRLKAQKDFVERTTPSAAWRAVLRFFLPAIVLLTLLYGVAYLLRNLR